MASRRRVRHLEDEGDGYGYEQGAWTRVTLRWKDAARRLTIGKREGEYSGMVSERDYWIVIFSSTGQKESHSVRYTGEVIQVEVQ